jgi:hypothetical protein
MEAYVKSDLPVLEPNIHYLQVTVICKWLTHHSSNSHHFWYFFHCSAGWSLVQSHFYNWFSRKWFFTFFMMQFNPSHTFLSSSQVRTCISNVYRRGFQRLISFLLGEPSSEQNQVGSSYFELLMKRTFFQVMVSNINKINNHISPQITEDKKGHGIRWKPRL